VNLSGGQKQRLGLARAVYAEKVITAYSIKTWAGEKEKKHKLC